MDLPDIIHNYHPRRHILYTLFFISAALFFSVRFELRIPEYDTAMRDYYFQWANFERIVFKEPVREEMSIRLAPWLMLVIMMLFRANSEPVRKFLDSKALPGLSALHLLFWTPMVILTVMWAAEHAWPLITFTIGIAIGAMIFYTRGVHYAVPGIFLAIVFHIFFNLCGFLGAIAKIHLLQ